MAIKGSRVRPNTKVPAAALPSASRLPALEAANVASVVNLCAAPGSDDNVEAVLRRHKGLFSLKFAPPRCTGGFECSSVLKIARNVNPFHLFHSFFFELDVY